MSRWIDAEWLLNFFEPYPDDYQTPLGTLRACVDDAPSIDIDRPQGEWILECDGEDECDDLYRCPFCGAKYGCAKYDKPNFCNECGADMRGDRL